MIKTKSIYQERSEGDGLRVLVTRYWPRGIRKEAVDMWLRDLGPDSELIRKWKSEEIPWEEFRKSYRAEFKTERKKELLKELREAIEKFEGGEATLLCTCQEEDRCHRSLLKRLLEGKRI